jgi:hypothetical protein
MELGQSISQSISNNMGATKKTYAEMTMTELLAHYPGHDYEDEDFQYEYEMWKQRKIEQYEQELMERQAYEQHLADKY